MNGMISYCGLDCQTCPIYIATRETDPTKKEKMIYKVISVCNVHYGINYKYEDINDCDGCKSVSGRIFTACLTCKIRACAIEKELEYCSHCSEYACDNLMDLFKSDPCAKTRLDIIRNVN